MTDVYAMCVTGLKPPALAEGAKMSTRQCIKLRLNGHTGYSSYESQNKSIRI